MPIRIDFIEPVNNDSLQLGDGVYYIMPRTGTCSIDPDDNVTEAMCLAVVPTAGVWTPTIGFNHSTSTPVFGGILTQISNNGGWIVVDDTNTQASVEITADTFIMFAKDSSVNLSGLTGYFAEVEIKNSSKVNAEMFSIGSEITVSSK